MATDPKREVNLVIGDTPDPCEDAGMLQAKAERCRRLAAGISDRQAAEVLTGMAKSYQDAAEGLAAKTKTD